MSAHLLINPICSVWLCSFLAVAANADTLAERNGPEYAHLPDSFSFDCATTVEQSGRVIDVLDRQLQIPNGFELSENQAKLVWIVDFDDSENSVAEWSLVTILWGYYKEKYELVEEAPIISEPSANSLGAHVRFIDPHLDAERIGHLHEIFFIKDQKFLKIASLVPVAWETLIPCFK